MASAVEQLKTHFGEAGLIQEIEKCVEMETCVKKMSVEKMPVMLGPPSRGRLHAASG